MSEFDLQPSYSGELLNLRPLRALARRCWGGGYNQELKHFMLAHAFQHVERVVFFIGENNRRSRIAIERLGAKLLEIVPARKPKQGSPYSSAVYAIDREDWI